MTDQTSPSAQNCNRFLQQAMFLFYISAVTLGAFIAGAWAIIGIGGSLVLFLAVWKKDWSVPRPNKELMAIALMALGTMAVLNCHSSDPVLSGKEWVKLTTIFLPLLLLSSENIQRSVFHPRFSPYVLSAAILGALALGLELFLGAPLLQAIKGHPVPLSQYNRGLSYLVLMSFPLLAGVKYGSFPQTFKKRLALMLLFILVLFIPAGLTESRASKLALILALLTTGAAMFWPLITRRVCEFVLLLCLSWAAVTRAFFLDHFDWLTSMPPSWRARIEIWDYISYRISERPYLGWGLGTSHTLHFKEPHGASYLFMTMPAAHPHNVILELWVELGLPGILLGLWFAFWMLQKASRLDKEIAPFAIGAWVAALCLSLVAYDFWTDSLFSCFALTAFAFAVLQCNKSKL